MSTIIENDKAYIAGTYARFPVALASGRGSLCYDEAGKEYICIIFNVIIRIIH